MMTHDDDDDVDGAGWRGEEEEQRAFLILGQSSSGKSTICRWLVRHSNKRHKTVVCNDNTASKAFPRVRWEDLDKLSHTAVVFEDLIAPTTLQAKQLQAMLSWNIHHRACSPLYLLGHSIYKNSLHPLLAHMTHVIVTCRESSLNSLVGVLTFYKFELEEKMRLKKMFQECLEPFSYLCLNVQTRHVEMGKVPASEVRLLTGGRGGGGLSGGPADSDTRTPAQIKAAMAARRFLAILPRPVVAQALFDLVFFRLPAKVVCPSTLTVSLTDATTRRTVRISLIDYFHMLSSESDQIPAADETLSRFHAYVLKLGICLPRCFVKNMSIPCTEPTPSPPPPAANRRVPRTPSNSFSLGSRPTPHRPRLVIDGASAGE
jgi:hypothetical protein